MAGALQDGSRGVQSSVDCDGDAVPVAEVGVAMQGKDEGVRGRAGGRTVRWGGGGKLGVPPALKSAGSTLQDAGDGAAVLGTLTGVHAACRSGRDRRRVVFTCNKRRCAGSYRSSRCGRVRTACPSLDFESEGAGGHRGEGSGALSPEAMVVAAVAPPATPRGMHSDATRFASVITSSNAMHSSSLCVLRPCGHSKRACTLRNAWIPRV